MKRAKMPVVFVGHGSPMNAIGKNRARDGWQKMGKELGKPKVILAISAHWSTRGLWVHTSQHMRQIYDMYGFPKELYQIHYEPKGNTLIANRALHLLKGMAKADNQWGIDHGVWSVLANMYPDADVPVVLISTDVTADEQAQCEVGRRLAVLREAGAMIVASGNVVHNLELADESMDCGYAWADAFDTRIRDAILAGDFASCIAFKELPDARLAVPTIDHYYPLLCALGAVEPTDEVSVWNEYRELGSMSMTSYVFQAAC